MRYQINLGPLGKYILKNPQYEEIKRCLEESSLPLRASKPIPIKKGLKADFIRLVTTKSQLTKVEYNFNTTGTLIIELFFTSGAHITLENSSKASTSSSSTSHRGASSNTLDKDSIELLEYIGSIAEQKIDVSPCSAMLFKPVKRISKVNQAKVELNIPKLVLSKPTSNEQLAAAEKKQFFYQLMIEIKNNFPSDSIEHFEMLSLYDWLYQADYNDAITFLNSSTKHSIYPPLSFMSILLKKYVNMRFGTKENADALYKLTCEKYSDSPQEELDIFASSYLLVFHFHQPHTELRKLRDLYNKNVSIATFNSLLKIHLGKLEKLKKSKANSEVIESEINNLFLENAPGFNSGTYKLRLQFIAYTKSVDGIKKYFKSIPRALLTDEICQDFLKILIRKKQPHDEVVKSYNELPLFLQETLLVKIALIENYAKNDLLEVALDEFIKIQEPTEEAFRIILSALAQQKKYEAATRLYEYALSIGLYKTTKISLIENVMKINFHHFSVSRDGIPQYGTYSRLEMEVFLHRAYNEICRNYNDKKLSFPLSFYCVCGVGTGKTREAAIDILTTFHWKAEIDPHNPGQVVFEINEKKVKSMLKYTPSSTSSINEILLTKVQAYIEQKYSDIDEAKTSAPSLH